jgi:hypothetical protein
VNYHIDDVDPEMDEAECRAESIKMLRRAEAMLAAGDASGVIVVMLDSDGFMGFYRSMMAHRCVYAEASAALDFLSGKMHENWVARTMEYVDPDGSPLRPVDSPLPEKT